MKKLTIIIFSLLSTGMSCQLLLYAETTPDHTDSSPDIKGVVSQGVEDGKELGMAVPCAVESCLEKTIKKKKKQEPFVKVINEQYKKLLLKLVIVYIDARDYCKEKVAHIEKTLRSLRTPAGEKKID